MKSLKNMPESLETMTDSDQLRPLFWSLRRCFDLFVDIHKRTFSLVEKCRVTSWPSTFLCLTSLFSVIWFLSHFYLFGIRAWACDNFGHGYALDCLNFV